VNSLDYQTHSNTPFQSCHSQSGNRIGNDTKSEFIFKPDAGCKVKEKTMKLQISIRYPKIHLAVSLAVVVIASFLLIGCKPAITPATHTAIPSTLVASSVTLTPTLLPTLAVVDLPQPEQVCAKSIDWRGIKPGVSTKQDVVNLLGEPEDQGFKRMTATSGANSFPFYTYKVDGGEIPGFVKNRIFFRADGVVDWIEVIVGDQDGSYHKVSEIAAELGNTLDAFYINSDIGVYVEPGKWFETHRGPDYFYIWSACGVAIDALPINPIDNALTIRYPNEPRGEVETSPNANSVILIKFLFIPTSYQGFKDYYLNKTPYQYAYPGGAWDAYIQKIDAEQK
jgi:hypothetical protein